jgi:acyl-CoA dehydrogenase
VGLLGLGFPDEYGGLSGVDSFHRLIASLELAQAGSGGLVASLMSHTIGAPPVALLGSAELKRRVLPAVLAGERIAALAITEPSGGSDVSALRCTAVREGDHYVVNGEKTFITSGVRADYLTVAVRTDPRADGARGISLLLVEGDTPGLSRTPLRKMGWWASDTAHLRFDDCRVPAGNLLGAEGAGFRAIMQNFNAERFSMAAGAVGFAWVCYQEALAWARERRTFGQRLVDHQVVRHRLVDMLASIEAARAMLEETAWRLDHAPAGDAELVASICLLKNLATRCMQSCADGAVQTLGGMGYMRGTRSERIYREVKVNMIGGGAEEIMKDLAARQLGL